MVDLIITLNQGVVRRFKVHGRYGEQVIQHNGLGQGDPFSVLIALLYVGVQMVAMHLQNPNVQSTAVINDRTIRGKPEDVCDAVAFVASLDKVAGHCNNLKMPPRW